MTMTTESIEFRAEDDDSWYDVKLTLKNGNLVVNYHQFPTDNVEFNPDRFETAEDVKFFKLRFRPLSSPLQDSECNKVVRGMIVCASLSFGNDDLYFYDAVVEEVLQEKHSFENGEELCKCKFLVYWTHGPRQGYQAILSVENICLIQSGDLKDPTLASFLQSVMKKLCGKTVHPWSFAEFDTPNGERVEHHIIGQQDTDIGSYHHVILIDNLEKDVSPQAIIEFIHQHISIPTLACVFPSLSSEQYARGAIMLSSGKHLNPLVHFLDNPDHLVVSSRGRPWVVPERRSRHDAFSTLIGSLMLEAKVQFQHEVVGSADLKVVHTGTKEYGTAKQWKDIFCEFVDYQKGLHEQLASSERLIVQSSCGSKCISH